MNDSEFNAWVTERYSFLTWDFEFQLQEPKAFWGIEYVSKIVRVSVCWYRDPGVFFWVYPDTFWIRPADPRTFDLREVVQFFNPDAVFPVCEFPFGNEEAHPYLDACATLLLDYGRPILRGDLRVCEDVLIDRQLRSLEPRY
jgi:hypothetical protein